MDRLRKGFANWLKAERERLFLWVPVWLGVGMALYYALPYEPTAFIYLSVPALLLLTVYRRRIPIAAALLLSIFLLTGTGAAYAKWRTVQMDVPMLAAPLSIRPVEGTITELAYIEKGVRITLGDVRIDRLSRKISPKSVRIAYRSKQLPELEIGQRISVRAALLPPSGPAMPGGFDFTRYFFFRHIGAVGYGIAPITPIAESSAHGFFLFWREAREHLTANIHKTLPGAEGAIASGLITGDDSAIPDDIHQELRASNLLHIIAISGAHMVVIGGIVFVVLRAMLVLIPGFGLRPAVKTITALLTLIAISLYLAITGFEISATRAYVMLALVLLAILLRREPKPMRSIALAALLMLAIDPSDIIEPGFQLSFAATLALIAAFEKTFDPAIIEEGRIRRSWKMFRFLLLTTVIAQAATTTIILFHFNNFGLYGVLSNLILTPVVTFLIMPAVALYFVLLPFGIEDIALYLLSPGIKAMLWVGKTVSAWPHALTYMPGPTEAGMALAMLGLCWICLWHSRARRYGAYAILIGTATLFAVRTPDLFLSPRAAQVAMDNGEGLILLKGRATGLFPKLWANASGHETMPEYRKVAPLSYAECTKENCRITHNGTRLHISFTVPDIKKGCPDADWWISGYYLFPNERKPCQNIQFFDRADFDSKGSLWGWFSEEGLTLETTRDEQGKRPWVAKPFQAPQYGSPHASGTPGGTPHTQSASSAP